MDGKYILVAFLGAIFCLPILFLSLGYFEQTETQPLTKLTLTKAGCEFIVQAGISADDKKGICTVVVRFRVGLGDLGQIERADNTPIKVSRGQVVGMVMLDDGSDAPWSHEHKIAIFWVVISMLLMLLWALSVFIGIATYHGENKK
jgi:hypothetical protein